MCLFDFLDMAGLEFRSSLVGMENTFDGDGVSDNRDIFELVEIDVFSFAVESSQAIDGDVVCSVCEGDLTIVGIGKRLDGTFDDVFGGIVFS